jgi:thiamine pyrophosphokinase
MHTLLVGGAPVDIVFLENIIKQGFDCIIAVDGGARHLTLIGINPQIVLGDFDSLSSEEVAALQDNGGLVRDFPEEKDWTDMELAVDTAIHEGATEITIVGGMGGRWDHSLANIGLLYRAERQGVRSVIIDPFQEMSLISPGEEIRLDPAKGRDFSLLPLCGEVRGVRAWGVKYPLENGVIRLGETLGVHNKISARRGHVIGGDGFLILIQFQKLD